MAATLQATDTAELEKQRKGYTGVSLSNWTATTEPQYTAGSSFECADSVYYCSALEDCGTDAQWAGIANSTLVYSYFDVSTLTFYWSSTAPAWDTAKSGFYHTVSTTHRCLASVYKDSSGNYTQKTIFLNREQGITYQGLCLISNTSNELHASLLWDGELIITNKLISNHSYLHSNSLTQNEIYDALSSYLPSIGNTINVNCTLIDGGANRYINRISRTGASELTFYGMAGGAVISITITDGNATAYPISIAW